MRTFAIACVFLAVACTRDNLDFTSTPAGPLPSTSNGPMVGGDLASAPAHDFGTDPKPADLSMPDDPPPDMGNGNPPGGDGGDPDPGSVACGMMSCSAPNVCCATLLGSSCVADGAACIGGTKFACDGPEDCESGDVCCSGTFGTTCQHQCYGEIRCHTQDDCDGGALCCPTLSGYPVCRKFHC
jgi:hypothetical protein